MKPNKKPYEAPDIVVTRVEVESSICTGSVENIKAQSPTATTEAQQVNDAFLNSNDFSTNGSFDTPN